MTKEIRYLAGAQFRAKSGSTIEGYAAVFDSRSGDLGGFVEVIKPGAFARAIRERQDVRCLFNHADSEILGRTKSGTLALSEDSVGLHFECRVAPTQRGKDVLASIERGDIDQCSFGFVAVLDRWTDQGGKPLRELLDVDLLDVSPVTFPAYQATSVSTRSLWPNGAPPGVRRHCTAGDRIAGRYCYRYQESIPGPRVILSGPLETERAMARVRLARLNS